jgi:hypothetical protein
MSMTYGGGAWAAAQSGWALSSPLPATWQASLSVVFGVSSGMFCLELLYNLYVLN